MKLANSIYVLCEDQKEIDKLEKICKAHGADADPDSSKFIKGKLYSMYRVVAGNEETLKLIEKEIEA